MDPTVEEALKLVLLKPKDRTYTTTSLKPLDLSYHRSASINSSCSSSSSCVASSSCAGGLSRSSSMDMDDGIKSVLDYISNDDDNDEDVSKEDKNSDKNSDMVVTTVDVDFDDDDDDDDVILTLEIPATSHSRSRGRVNSNASNPIIIPSDDSDSDDVTLISDMVDDDPVMSSSPRVGTSALALAQPYKGTGPQRIGELTRAKHSLFLPPIKSNRSCGNPQPGMKRMYEDDDDDDDDDDDIMPPSLTTDDSSSSSASSSLSVGRSLSSVSVINGNDPFLSDASGGDDILTTGQTFSVNAARGKMYSGGTVTTRFTTISDQDDDSDQSLFGLFSTGSGNSASGAGLSSTVSPVIGSDHSGSSSVDLTKNTKLDHLSGKPFLTSSSVISTFQSLKECSGGGVAVSSELKDTVLSGTDLASVVDQYSGDGTLLSDTASGGKTSRASPASLTFAISQLLSSGASNDKISSYRSQTVSDMRAVLHSDNDDDDEDDDSSCHQFSSSLSTTIVKSRGGATASSTSNVTTSTSSRRTDNISSSSRTNSASSLQHAARKHHRHRRSQQQQHVTATDNDNGSGTSVRKSLAGKSLSSSSLMTTQPVHRIKVSSGPVVVSQSQGSDSQNPDDWKVVSKGDCKVLLRRSQSMTTGMSPPPTSSSHSLSLGTSVTRVAPPNKISAHSKRSRRSTGCTGVTRPALQSTSKNTGSVSAVIGSQPDSGSTTMGGAMDTGLGSVIVIVEEEKQLCYGCRKEVLVSQLSYCMAGHGCCGRCLQTQVKTLLALGRKGTLKCRYVACNSFYLVSQLRNSLPPMVVEILEEKLDREYCENAAKLMLQADNSAFSSGGGGVNSSSSLIGDEDLMGGIEGGASGGRGDRQNDGFVIELPKNWEPMSPNEEYRLVEIVRGCDEYKWVSALFHQSMSQPRASIMRIRRVQNQILWQFYIVKKRQMERENAKPVIEKNLFHGTCRTVVDAICKNNFDWRLCGSHGTMYGQGSYFARDACYSHMYTDQPIARSISTQAPPPPPPPPTNPAASLMFTNMHPSMQVQQSSGGGPQPGGGSGGPCPQQILFHAAFPGSSHSVSIAALQSCRFARLPIMSTPCPLMGGASQPSNNNAGSASNQSHTSTPASFQNMNFSSYWVGGHPPTIQSKQMGPPPVPAHSNVSHLPPLPPLPSHIPQPHPLVHHSMQHHSQQQVQQQQPQIQQGGGRDRNGAMMGVSKPQQHVHCMFLARVLIGDYALGRGNYRKPPPVDSSNPYGRCYDSCVNDTNNPSIYVIFNHAQCYPEYTVEYTNQPRESMM